MLWIVLTRPVFGHMTHHYWRVWCSPERRRATSSPPSPSWRWSSDAEQTGATGSAGSWRRTLNTDCCPFSSWSLRQATLKLKWAPRTPSFLISISFALTRRYDWSSAAGPLGVFSMPVLFGCPCLEALKCGSYRAWSCWAVPDIRPCCSVLCIQHSLWFLWVGSLVHAPGEKEKVELRFKQRLRL